MTQAADRLPLFPDSTTILDNAINIGGLDLPALARQFGTPLYVYDVTTMDAAVQTYRDALRAHYPAQAEVTYAGKAFLCAAVAEWAARRGLWVDCTGATEIGVAHDAQLDTGRMVVHGVNKSEADLEAAIQWCHTIVVDNLDELALLIDLLKSSEHGGSGGAFGSLWLRLQPGVLVPTHHPHTQTGGADSKFGMTADEMAEAARLARRANLPLDGIHFHLGSNFADVGPLVRATDIALLLAKDLGFTGSWHFSPGGGLGVAYREDELPHPEIEMYVRSISESVAHRCRQHGLPLPMLHLEPGRSLIARAGVAVYRIGAVKRRKRRSWLLVDGGMSDNPRYALYGARYTCLPGSGLGRDFDMTVSIAGPHCESGDILLEDLLMPSMEIGELIAIPMSGAYHLSMASNYNGACRPAVIWLEDRRARLIVRRETPDDLRARDRSELQSAA
jgi:diaminopimelate decarboxylase